MQQLNVNIKWNINSSFLNICIILICNKYKKFHYSIGKAAILHLLVNIPPKYEEMCWTYYCMGIHLGKCNNSEWKRHWQLFCKQSVHCWIAQTDEAASLIEINWTFGRLTPDSQKFNLRINPAHLEQNLQLYIERWLLSDWHLWK